jgi:methionyl-tRNA synthetase
MASTERALVTAALPYINNVPHVGHIVGSHLPADIIARYLRAKGHDVLFVGGSDESGTTSEIAARKAGLPVQEFCTRLHRVHKRIYEWFRISYDIYSRTSEPVHHEMTRAVFAAIYENGYVVPDTVEQLYCEQDKLFLADRYVQGTCPFCGYEDANGDQCEKCGKLMEQKELKSPRCTVCGSTPELRSSRHLFLRLDALAPRLEDWIDGCTHWRSQVRAEALGKIREGLNKRAITRDLEWGVRVPIDGFRDKVFYVWFDAPIGYASFTRQLAPERWEQFWKDPGTRIYHVLGKDNIVFHTLWWPGMLMAEGSFNLPYRVDGLQFLNYEGKKISKSKAWGVFCERMPEAEVDPDLFRAYLTFLIPETADTEFKWEGMERRINTEVIGTLANFIHRALSLSVSRLGGRLERPADADMTEHERDLVANLAKRAGEIDRHLAAGELRAAWHEVLGLAADGNRFFDYTEPWKLAKTDPERARGVLYLAANVAKALATFMSPFVPGAGERAWALLGLAGSPTDPGRWEEAGTVSLPSPVTLEKPTPLFPKLVPEEMERIREIVTRPTALEELLEREGVGAAGEG